MIDTATPLTPLHVAAIYAFIGGAFSLTMWSIAGHRVQASALSHALAGFRFALFWPYYAARIAARVARRLGGKDE